MTLPGSVAPDLGAASPPAGTRRSQPAPGISLVLAGATLTFSLAQTLVIPALPAVEQAHGVSAADSAWLLSAFLLAACVSTPVLGRLGDMYGKRRLLLLSLAVFGAGAVVCALAASFPLLVAGRVLSGLGAAIVPLAYGLARDHLPAERLAGGVGLISATLGVGGGVGFVVSGVISEHLPLPWLFWPSAAVTAVVAWWAWRRVPESPQRAEVHVDWAGALLLAAALLPLLVAISRAGRLGWTSTPVALLLAAALVAAVGWWRWEALTAHPMVDPRLLCRRAVWPANSAAFAVGFATYGALVLVPRFVQVPEASGYGLDASASAAGLFVLPYSLATFVCGLSSGPLMVRYGARAVMMLGAACAFAGYAGLALQHGSPLAVYAGCALLGCGSGFIIASIATAIVQGVRAHQAGVATGFNSIMRQVGGALGGQASAAMLGVEATGVPAEARFVAAFALSALAALAVMAAAAAMRPQGWPA